MNKKELINSIKKYLLAFPAIIISILFFIIPFILLIFVSFTEKSSFFFTPKITLANFYKAFTLYRFDYQNTLFLSASAAFLDVVFGYPFAYLMTRKIKRFSDLFRSILLIPLFGELYIAFGLWYLFLPKGPLAPLFEKFGIEVFKAFYSMPSAMVALAIYTFPFAVLQIGIALSEIDPVYEEAASCLGAGPLNKLFKILIPLSMPGILSGWLMAFGWNLGAYAIPLLMGGAIVGQRVVSVQIRAISLVMMDFGMGAALAVSLVFLAIFAAALSIKIGKGELI